MSIHSRHFFINWFFFFIIPVLIPSGLYATDSSRNIFKKKSDKFLEKALKAIEINQYSEAETMAYKAIRFDSSNVKSFLLLSDISDELEKPEQKKQALRKVISLDSINFPLASKLLADIYFKEGDYANSLINVTANFLLKRIPF
jgi:tetratricopeptide (TPR) repeat protein